MSMMHLRGQSAQGLDCRAAELDRIDTAVVAATKFGVRLPSSDLIFSKLNEASMTSAAVIDAHRGAPIPFDVRTGLLRLQCSVSDLVTSLRLYSALAHPTARYSMMAYRPGDSSQLH
jgi:hypothetical protein